MPNGPIGLVCHTGTSWHLPNCAVEYPLSLSTSASGALVLGTQRALARRRRRRLGDAPHPYRVMIAARSATPPATAHTAPSCENACSATRRPASRSNVGVKHGPPERAGGTEACVIDEHDQHVRRALRRPQRPDRRKRRVGTLFASYVATQAAARRESAGSRASAGRCRAWWPLSVSRLRTQSLSCGPAAHRLNRMTLLSRAHAPWADAPPVMPSGTRAGRPEASAPEPSAPVWSSHNPGDALRRGPSARVRRSSPKPRAGGSPGTSPAAGVRRFAVELLGQEPEHRLCRARVRSSAWLGWARFRSSKGSRARS